MYNKCSQYCRQLDEPVHYKLLEWVLVEIRHDRTSVQFAIESLLYSVGQVVADEVLEKRPWNIFHFLQ